MKTLTKVKTEKIWNGTSFKVNGSKDDYEFHLESGDSFDRRTNYLKTDVYVYDMQKLLTSFNPNVTSDDKSTLGKKLDILISNNKNKTLEFYSSNYDNFINILALNYEIKNTDVLKNYSSKVYGTIEKSSDFIQYITNWADRRRNFSYKVSFESLDELIIEYHDVRKDDRYGGFDSKKFKLVLNVPKELILDIFGGEITYNFNQYICDIIADQELLEYERKFLNIKNNILNGGL